MTQSSGCASTGCGGTTTRADACCGLDEQIKDAGGSGCGSAASKAATERAKGNLAPAYAGATNEAVATSGAAKATTKSCCG